MGSLLEDVTYALRGIRRSPSLVVAVCLSLGLAMGGNTTVFSWLRSMVLDPYPTVPEAGSLVVLNLRSPEGDDWPVSYPIVRAWQEGVPGISGIAAWSTAKLTFRTPGQERTRLVYAMLVSGAYFDVLRVPPSLGAGLSPAHEAERAPVAVVSHLFWERELAADPGVVGRVILLNGHPVTVLGVAPPGFLGTYLGVSADLWVPVTLHPLLTGSPLLDRRESRWLQTVARLTPGADRAAAGDALDARTSVESRAAGDTPVTGAMVRLPREQFLGSLVTPLLTAMLVVSGLVLLVACANVANLLSARATARVPELELRRALGAGPARIARMLVVESAVLAALGCAVGLLVTIPARPAFLGLAPTVPLPVALEVRMDGTVLAFAAAMGVGTVLVFGLLPSLRASAARARSARGSTGTRRERRTQGVLVALQVAFSIVALTGASLFLRSLSVAADVDVGVIEPERVLVVNTDLTTVQQSAEAGLVLSTELLEEARRLPGVRAASLTTMLPLGFGGHRYAAVEADGYVAAPDEDPNAERVAVSDGYFETLGIGIVRGRAIGPEDRADGARVVVVDESFARRFWPGQEALGRRVRQGNGWATVVGVARDAKYRNLDDAGYEVAYWPLAQEPQPAFSLQLRTDGPAGASIEATRALFARIHPDLPFDTPRSLSEHMEASTFVQRVGGTMVGALGLVSLAITMVGIYGIVSYAVARRTREIGVRVALGAARASVLRLALGGALWITLAGVVLGVPLALGLGAALTPQLVGVTAADPLSYTAACLGVILVSLVAAWAPARRASRISPVCALAEE